VSRDHRELKVFVLADELVLEVYKLTAGFSPQERFGLQSQIRRAAVSVPTNLVEGCARRSTRDYLQFVTIALGSASEARYLLDVSTRLGLLPKTPSETLAARYHSLIRGLQRLVTTLSSAAT
jgi:four helix bundle protein